MRKLGLDFGDARIGLALSDPLGIFATGLETYHRKNLDADLKHIANLIQEKQVDTVVAGLPINMDGSMGPRVDKTKEFCEKLQEVCEGIVIEYLDERLTTVAAEKMLIEADVRREDRKKVIDKVAATIILQSFLDRK